MTDSNEMLVKYVKEGGLFPVVFMRGFSEAGRFGLKGEGLRIPEDQQEAYQKGVEAAAAVRSVPFETPWTDKTSTVITDSNNSN